MNENINPQTVPEEQSEVVTEISADAPADSSAEYTAYDPAANAAENVLDETKAEADLTTEEEEPKKKKKRLLQVPVIISLCLVAAVLLSYFVFTAFFLREPEGVTWTTEYEGVPYYFEFDRNGVFKGYVGTVEIESTYAKEKNSETGNTLTVNATVCNFYSGYPATYTVSGSRILGNQTLDFSYGEGYDYSLSQGKREEFDLELPKDFTADEKLLGEWVFQYYGYDIYRVTFNDDGSMVLKFEQDGITYNGTYTIDNGTINFTYYVSDAVAAPLEYSIDGDSLNFMGAVFVRPESLATADEAAALTVQ